MITARKCATDARRERDKIHTLCAIGRRNRGRASTQMRAVANYPGSSCILPLPHQNSTTPFSQEGWCWTATQRLLLLGKPAAGQLAAMVLTPRQRLGASSRRRPPWTKHSPRASGQSCSDRPWARRAQRVRRAQQARQARRRMRREPRGRGLGRSCAVTRPRPEGGRRAPTAGRAAPRRESAV